MVSEQIIAAHAKSKMAANLVRLGFIDVFLVLRFSVYICVGLFLAAPYKCVSAGKAEIAVQTRQVFVDALRRAGAFPGASSRRVNERNNHNPPLRSLLA